ncbi:hypothetical protein JHK82_039909 [Glycine max]|nr:hypothetical protein JHK82_039909 [Glycine max]
MSHYSYTFVATQDTFALTQPQQILFEPNTSSFTQLLSTLFSTNLLGSRTFANTEDQPHPYLSTLVVEPTSSTQPNGPEFAVESGLPNEELNPFNEDEDKVLYNQPQEEDHEEVELVSLITIVPPYYIPQHMQNFKESNFQDFEYGHSLDHEEVQHLVGTLFEDHAKLSYLLISKSIHKLIENNPSTSVSALIAHIKSAKGYTTTYHKAWLAKQKVIDNIYDNWERSYHNLPRLL